MSKRNKILIEIRGGSIANIAANNNIDIVVIDWDNWTEGGEYSDYDIYVRSADQHAEKIWELVDGDSSEEKAIREQLKELNF